MNYKILKKNEFDQINKDITNLENQILNKTTKRLSLNEESKKITKEINSLKAKKKRLENRKNLT
jgi:septal ring factor EnvC (AmiA/AmiB activator)